MPQIPSSVAGMWAHFVCPGVSVGIHWADPTRGYHHSGDLQQKLGLRSSSGRRRWPSQWLSIRASYFMTRQGRVCDTCIRKQGDHLHHCSHSALVFCILIEATPSPARPHCCFSLGIKWASAHGASTMTLGTWTLSTQWKWAIAFYPPEAHGYSTTFVACLALELLGLGLDHPFWLTFCEICYPGLWVLQSC